MLFGAGEAGCFPNITRAFSNWLPQSERVRSQGIIWLSARWGGAFTPLLVAILFQYLTWRQAFCAFGMLGVIWAVAFYLLVSRQSAGQEGRESGGTRPAEVQRSAAGARQRAVGQIRPFEDRWLLCGQYFALSFPWYFLITWAPTFIDERFHVDLTNSTILKMLPLLFGGIGSLFSGMIAAPLTRMTGSIED